MFITFGGTKVNFRAKSKVKPSGLHLCIVSSSRDLLVTKSQNVVSQKIKIHGENTLLVGRHLRALNISEVGKSFNRFQFHFCLINNFIKLLI